jgi:ArsR family transcriptional regulator, virulence genes transcriptional regulator
MEMLENTTTTARLLADLDELKDRSDEAADLLSAMSNSKRLLILCNLISGEMPVGQLADTVGLSQSALSQHLAKLRARKLVTTRRDAQTIYYSIASDSVYEILNTVHLIYVGKNRGRVDHVEKRAVTN